MAKSRLTQHEESVLEDLARGMWPKEIASQRAVSVSAISKVCRRAENKLEARTLYQAVLLFALKRYDPR
jgi:DNA-binding NarL/FixJ family response regulator